VYVICKEDAFSDEIGTNFGHPLGINPRVTEEANIAFSGDTNCKLLQKELSRMVVSHQNSAGSSHVRIPLETDFVCRILNNVFQGGE